VYSAVVTDLHPGARKLHLDRSGSSSDHSPLRSSLACSSLPICSQSLDRPVSKPRLKAAQLLITDSFAASASIKLASTCSFFPSTSPASTHWATVRINKLSNTSLPHRARAFDSTL